MDEIAAQPTDWTWVVVRPCPQCGLDAARVDRGRLGPAVRQATEAWSGALAGPGARRRPGPAVWSPLEYGCHVRDVLRVMDGRLDLMLTQDDPTLPVWDPDGAAVAERYAEQDPAPVGPAVADGGRRLAERLAGLADQQWQRTGTRADGAAFTVESLSRYLLHEVVHHLHDAGAGPAGGGGG